MASEIFSQSDIDALLGGGTPAAAASPSAPAHPFDPEVQIYDFRRPYRVSKERLRTLEAMYGRLTKSLEGWLMGRVRGQVILNLLSVEQFSFGEFLLSLPSPCASYIFDVRDSGGQQGVIDLGHEFAYFVVDRLFGGSGTPVVPERPLSSIERMAVQGVAERITALLSEIWQDHVQLELGVSGFESIPEILQVANREDPVLVANIEVSAAGISSLLIICMPLSVLEKFFASTGQQRVKNATGSQRERETNRALTETLLRTTHVPISARLPEFRLAMRDLASLEVGNVLSTGVPCGAEVQVRVGGQPRFRGAYGRVGGKLALQILDPVSAPDASAAPLSSDTES